MSRCFPFPPPGYVVNGIRDEAMIESIKGAEDKCNKEQRKKERKRDNKENKDKKDKKRKERERGEGESEKHSHKRRPKEEVAKDVQNNQKVDVFGKLKESEINCLEKSSLTVERELVQSTSQNSCDSTLNSNDKVKQPLNGRHNSNELPKEMEKEKQPLDGRHNNNNDSESIIRIRLPIRRPKDPEVMVMTNKDQPCPSREIKLDSLVTKEQPQQHPCSTSAPQQEKRKKHTSSRKHKEKKKVPSSTTQETYQPSRLCRLCPPSVAEHFLNVVENWVPNTIESRVELTNSEDDDESWWLMKKKKPSSHKIDTCKQLNRNNETKEVLISSSIAWPRASLLPEADVYALPYTVPF
ncbi:hypothetical protein Bca4012_080974 [Brassica carinata]|uniref:Uncharacterized protein n=1 Tax=Brassica carinata TaxID=52824 RepID=A0A8X7P4P6_BRACI|nr:hypothetical protein Bca52824_094799 [Brassica carinata]